MGKPGEFGKGKNAQNKGKGKGKGKSYNAPPNYNGYGNDYYGNHWNYPGWGGYYDAPYNGKGNWDGYDGSFSGKNQRVWLNCACGNSVPADRKFTVCTKCSTPWHYPDGCKHDPNKKGAPPDKPSPQLDETKFANDKKTKDFIQKMASFPAFAAQAATFQTLLKTVGGEGGEDDSLLPDLVSATKSLKEATAKVVTVASKISRNADQLAAAKTALLTLTTAQLSLEREEDEAEQDLVKAKAVYDEVASLKSKEHEEAKQQFQDVRDEMDLNPNDEVMGDEGYQKFAEAAKQRYLAELQREYGAVSRKIAGTAAPSPPTPTPPPTLSPQQLVKNKQMEEDREKAQARAAESMSNINKAAKTAAGQSAASASTAAAVPAEVVAPTAAAAVAPMSEG